jgi:uncharacterized protein (DUF1015 family)
VPRVLPFRGLRYDPKIAPDLAQVVCPPYDVIDPAERVRLEAQSTHNAVHLELPSDPTGQPGSRYTAAAQRLRAWRQEHVLALDPEPAYYLSETTFTHAGESLRRRDLLAALEVEPWEQCAVLPHEHTMAGPKADRLELLRATHLNCSPIWVLQRDSLSAVEEAWSATDTRAPDIEFTWRDEGHRIWLVDDTSSMRAIQQAFENGPPLYIADGHHRYETALAFRNETHSNLPGARAMLAAITWAADPGLQVLPTHRVLRGLDEQLTLEEAEATWSEWFHLEYFPIWDNAPAEQIDALMQQLASTGRSGPTFGLLGLGQLDLFGLLSVRGSKAPNGVLPAERSEAWRKLDVSLAHALLIDNLIAATGKPREEVLSYTRDPHVAFHAVREGQASAAIFLNATPVDGVLAVADAHDRMPEKSTYFYPKPPAGPVMRDLSI